MAETKFTWIPFYEEFAKNLLAFKDNAKRPELVNKIKELNAEWIKFIKAPTKDNDFNDIDPFTVYAIFNRSSGIEKRKAIIASLKSKFNVDAAVPSDFDGIPIVNSQKSCFYYEDEDIASLLCISKDRLDEIKRELQDDFREGYLL